MENTISLESLLGKRILARIDGLKTRGMFSSDGRTMVREYKVLEASPSGAWIKLMDEYGSRFWRPIGDVKVVEILKAIVPTPKASEAAP